MANAGSDIAALLTQDEIPIKLRCASCNRLVINAFRLPCCDQNVCETCQTILPESCPVCMHNPLSSDDCKPNKSLRLTVKAFLKSEEKKRTRDQQAPSSLQNETPTTTPPQAQPPAPDSEARNGTEKAEEEQVVNGDNGQSDSVPSSPSSSVVITLEAPDETGESRAPGFSQPSQQFYTAPDYNGRFPDPPLRPSADPTSERSRPSATHDSFNSIGYNVSGMGFTNGMSSNGDFNPMMTMQGMMGQGNWPAYPNTMSMPGMAMDFMSVSPGIFGGFNGQGMGWGNMNGIPMGIGFGDTLGSWGNHSAMGLSNGGNVEFGTDAGYYPVNGYNQQSHQKHFNQMHHQQFSVNNYKQNRFHGRGYQRGNERDRAGQITHSQMHNRSSHDRNFEQTASTAQGSGDISAPLTQAQQDTRSVTEKAHEEPITRSDLVEAYGQDRTGEEQNLGERVDEERARMTDGEVSAAGEHSSGTKHSESNIITPTNKAALTSETPSLEVDGFQPIQTITSSELPMQTVPVNSEATELAMLAPRGPAALYAVSWPLSSHNQGNSFNQRPSHGMHDTRGASRGHGPSSVAGSQRHGDADQVTSTPKLQRGQGVAGAPTGPKAMRDANSDCVQRSRIGTQIKNNNGPQESSKSSAHPVWPESKEVNGPVDFSSKPLGTKKPPGVHRSRSNSRSHSQPPHHEQEREGHTLPDANDDTTEHGTRLNSETRRRRRDPSEHSSNSGRRSREKERLNQTESRSRHREDIANKHRSSRHERVRRGSRSNGARDLSPKAPSGRSRGYHRHPSERELAPLTRIDDEQGKPRKKSHRDRSLSMDRHRNAQDRDGHDRRRSEHPASSRRLGRQRTPSPAPIREFKIKDRSKENNREHRKEIEPKLDGSLNIDPHTREREERNRERMLREQQRRDSLVASSTSKKRSADAVDDNVEYKSSRRKHRQDAGRTRRTSYQYDESDEGRESRALRVENEREAARWG